MKWIVASLLAALIYSPAVADKTIDGWSPPIEAEVVPPVRVSAPPPNPHYGAPATRSGHWYGGITILGVSAPDQRLNHDVHGRDFSVDVDLSGSAARSMSVDSSTRSAPTRPSSW